MMNCFFTPVLLVPMFLVLISVIVMAKGENERIEKMDMNVETRHVEQNLDGYIHNWDDGFTESKVSLPLIEIFSLMSSPTGKP